MNKTIVKVEKLEGNVAKIAVTIEPKEAKDAYVKMLKKMGSNVNISGFRKGKAPANIVEKYVGIDNIKAETLNVLYSNNISKILKDNELDLAYQPSIDEFDYEFGKEFTFIIKAELKPEFTPAKYKGETIEFEEYKTPEDSLKKELEALQTRFSTLIEVKGRKTNATDTVVFDFEGFLNGEPFEHGKAEKYTLDLVNSNFIPGFAEQLVGKVAGEEFTIDVTFPETYHAENLKGQKTQFKILIHEIKEKSLPELDDELAKKSGKFSTLADLKADIEKYLTEFSKKENEKRQADAAFDHIIAKTKMEIQKPMIEREVEAIRNESMQRALQQGAKWDDIVKAEGGIEKINAQIEPEAFKRIKNTLIVEKISSLEHIEISQQDIVEQINIVASAYGAQAPMVIEQIKNNPQSFTILTQQAATKKVTDILLKENTFKAVKQAAKNTKKG